MSEVYEMSTPHMSDAHLARVLALVQKTDERFDWRGNPFFQGLGAMAREDFIETQIQFFWAVTFFSRPMALLVGKIPRTGQRVEVL